MAVGGHSMWGQLACVAPSSQPMSPERTREEGCLGRRLSTSCVRAHTGPPAVGCGHKALDVRTTLSSFCSVSVAWMAP